MDNELEGTDRLMCVMEGACPKCLGDLTITEIAGVRAWLHEHWQPLDVLSAKSVAELMAAGVQRIGDNRTIESMDCEGYFHPGDPGCVKCKVKDHCATQIPHRPHIVLWDVPDAANVVQWDEPEEPKFSDRGVIQSCCYQCATIYETYQGCGNDWVLAEGGMHG